MCEWFVRGIGGILVGLVLGWVGVRFCGVLDCAVLCLTSSVPFLGSSKVRTRNPEGPKLISERSKSHLRESVFHLWGFVLRLQRDRK
jgi:hypothetical protein